MSREYKEWGVQLNKKLMETNFENSPSRQNQSSLTNKVQFSLFWKTGWAGSFLVHASGNHKYSFPRLIGDCPWSTPYHLRKFQYYHFLVIRHLMENQFHSPSVLSSWGHVHEILHFVSSSMPMYIVYVINTEYINIQYIIKKFRFNNKR